MIGGTVCHTAQLLVHDFTHFLGHPNTYVNRAFAIFCNIATGIPAAEGFLIYHADHHNFLGEQGLDTDLPSYIEAKLAKENGRWIRVVFLFLFPLIYLVRPLVTNSHRLTKG